MAHDDEDNERPKLALEEVVYNVAIGSNMDGAKLRSRKSGDGGTITPLSDGVPCKVHDWALSFDFLFLPPTEPVMAAAVRKEGSTLNGVLWKLSKIDYDTLARTEGCTGPHAMYIEEEVLAHPYSGPPVRALVFALRNPPQSFPAHLHPSERYMRMLIEGARAAKLEVKVVAALEAAPTARMSHPAVRAWSRFAMMGLFFLYRSKRVMLLARRYYRPVIAALYSRREAAIRGGKPGLGRVWTALMLAVLAPCSMLGLLRAIVQRKNVLSIARVGS